MYIVAALQKGVKLHFEKRKCVIYIPIGPGSSSGKTLGYEVDGLGSIPGVVGVEIFFTPSCPVGPEVHPASLKMSTSGFPRGYRRPSVGLTHSTSSQCRAVYIMWILASTSPVAVNGL